MRAILQIIAARRVAALAFVAMFVGALTFVAIIAASCAPRFDFVGQWEGHRTMKGDPAAAPYVMFTANTIKLNIKPNGRFELQDMGIPEQGNVSFLGHSAVLTVTEIMGVDMERQSVATLSRIGPIELTAQSDGTILYSDPKSIDPSIVRLKRIATVAPTRP